MKTNEELNLDVEIIKKDIQQIKNNHLAHIEADISNIKGEVKEIKIEMFRFKYVAYGAIVVFVLMSDKFTDILRLL